MTGKTIAHYQIQEKLGEGGMGVVYRALDTHLDRPVAIKVLRAEAVANLERKKRFVQEAKAASALNHPGIVTIHDISAADGIDYMVMEFIAGKPLDRLINRRGLPLAETLDYAAQMADALATAHAAGIVHRDIKPGNLMVTDAGRIKVLDFGLAKLTETAGSDDLAPTIDDAPRTEEGAILGTVAYMSPEQAEGKPVDARSDIFSFGSVLYEMTTGRRPFQGETRMSTLTAILREDPKPAGELAEDLPRELERILTYCLRKDPRRRIQHMDDLKIALEGLKEESDSGKLTRVTPAPAGSRRLLWPAVAGIAVAALVAVAWWVRRTPPPAPAPAPVKAPVLTRLTSDSGLNTEPAVSPDGKMLAYASDRSGDGNLDVWVQHLAAGGAPVRLTRDAADEREPDISPDGGRVAFRSEREGGGVYVAPTLGGEPRLLVPHGRRPRFSPDGSQIAYWVGTTGGSAPAGRIYVMASTGGQPRQLFPEFTDARYPVWSPDGKHLLCLGVQRGSRMYDWWVGPSEGGAAVGAGVREAGRGQAQQFFFQTVPSAWVAKGNRILFSAQSGDSANLWQLSLTPGTWKAAGVPQRLTFGTGLEVDPSVSSDGKVVFSSDVFTTDLWSLTSSGERKRITQDAAIDHRPSVSADGRKLAFSSNRAGNFDVWLKDLETGKETTLASTPEQETFPVILRDGSRVAYLVRPAIYVVSAAGGVPEKLCDDCRRPDDWSSDGSRIFHLVRDLTGFGSLNVETRQKTAILRNPPLEFTSVHPSPDGRWLTFRVQYPDKPLTRKLFVVAYRGDVLHEEKDWIAVTDGKGLDREPRWSSDGNSIFILSDRDGFRCIWVQRLDPATKRPAGPLTPLHHFHDPRLNFMHIENTGLIGLAVAPGNKLIFALGERTGNVWMTRLEE